MSAHLFDWTRSSLFAVSSFPSLIPHKFCLLGSPSGEFLSARVGRNTSLIRAALQAAPGGQNEWKVHNQCPSSIRDGSYGRNIQRFTEFEDEYNPVAKNDFKGSR